MSALARDDWYMTPDEYLEFERKSETKHDYINGLVVAMSGVLGPHSIIQGNVSGRLHRAFDGPAQGLW